MNATITQNPRSIVAGIFPTVRQCLDYVLKMAVALSAAATITALLLYFMQALIAGADVAPKQEPGLVIDVPLMPKYPPEVILKDPAPRLIEVLPSPDMLVPPTYNFDDLPSGPAVIMGPPAITPRDTLFSQNSNPLPMATVAPQYPTRAAAKGIEGYVDVLYSVATSGAVKDVQVVAFHPSEIFNRAAIKAISRWKYKPQMQDGMPIEVNGLMKRIRFELDK